MGNEGASWWVVVLLFLVVVPVQAQLVTQDDSYGVRQNEPLLVEPPGVLENDTVGGEPADEQGATAELVRGPRHGTLSCAAEPGLELCPDGSFAYTKGESFAGVDTFVYQARLAAETSQSMVTLSACTGGPTVFVCWKEAPYLIKLGELGMHNFREGFEDDAAWGMSRSPSAVPAAYSNGIKWESNHPDPPAGNELTTGPGPLRTGQWAVFDANHGYATGTPAICDVEFPPDDCLYKDGLTGTREVGETTLYGVGGHFSGTATPNLAMILDGGVPIRLGWVSNGPHQFYGVIDSDGFSSFRVEETDGKIGQARFVFSDDYVFGTTPADVTPPQVLSVNTDADTGDGQLSEGELTAVSITRIFVGFSELMLDHATTADDSVTNPANYLLFSDRGDGFDTVDCTGGIDAGDVAISVDRVTYLSGSEALATLDLNSGLRLPPGSYRLLVCGTTTIRDGAGHPLDGDGDGIGGDDFRRNFTVTGDAPPGHVPATLQVYKSNSVPGDLRLSWTGSCSNEATDYAIYEGTLGAFDSHVAVDCADDGGDLEEEISPQAADSYYLVVPVSPSQEGSYGVDSGGTERPVPPDPADRCLESQTIGGC